MTTVTKPVVRPTCPYFSSGPTAKRPGFHLGQLEDAALGRSHRSKIGKAKLKEAIDLTREALGVPDDYLIGIVPASDTGAVEMAMWSMLGERPVDVFAWESFGEDWVKDTLDQLTDVDATAHVAKEYGTLPDFTKARDDADIIFTWNGTTSGVKVPNADWIVKNPDRVVFNDATSAAFAQDIDWDKVDVTTFSWQKILGGEAAHGMLILSPAAVARLERYVPNRPLPKIFRMTKKGKINEGIFVGETINTPSMLCVEDYIQSLKWALDLGGWKALKARSDESLAALEAFVAENDWIDFLCADKETRSNTGVTLKITDPRFTALSADDQAAFMKKMTGLLEKEGVAFDANGYRAAPPGLRIWCGATVEPSDVKALTPWLTWAFEETIAA
ncbi:MAG: phosphoserine transaminase [Ponticaulis sp.]|nr:phosphoserine transaminase [Ponticaulis sp.]|tara:strand:- start:4107 stop:5270 length:1164 start_codon:yes stop_codon:yes gene_type:complete